MDWVGGKDEEELEDWKRIREHGWKGREMDEMENGSGIEMDG